MDADVSFSGSQKFKTMEGEGPSVLPRGRGSTGGCGGGGY